MKNPTNLWTITQQGYKNKNFIILTTKIKKIKNLILLLLYYFKYLFNCFMILVHETGENIELEVIARESGVVKNEG